MQDHLITLCTLSPSSNFKAALKGGAAVDTFTCLEDGEENERAYDRTNKVDPGGDFHSRIFILIRDGTGVRLALGRSGEEAGHGGASLAAFELGQTIVVLVVKIRTLQWDNVEAARLGTHSTGSGSKGRGGGHKAGEGKESGERLHRDLEG